MALIWIPFLGRLFEAEYLDRLHRCCAACGVGAEEQAGQYGGAEREGDRVGRDHGLNTGDRELAADHAGDDAGGSAEQRNEDRLDQELLEDVAAARSNGLAYS